jgi:hypothetical protein
MTEEVRLFHNAAADVMEDLLSSNSERKESRSRSLAIRKRGIDLLTQAGVGRKTSTQYSEPARLGHGRVRESGSGGALLVNGDYNAAEKVFRAGFLRRPRNGRALFGLAEVCASRARKRRQSLFECRFEKAWHYADTKLSVGSLFGGSEHE